VTGGRALDLFAGLRGWSAEFAARGWDVTTLDNDTDGTFAADFCMDILDVRSLADLERGRGRFDVVLASPPCTAFSVAAMGRNWERYMGRNPVNGKTEWLIRGPKHARAELGMRIAEHTFRLVDEYAPRLYVVENPVGAMRVMPFVIGRRDRATTWYCQWGETRAKPTDLWTNIRGEWPICRPGSGDHEPAPRGAKTGTQGLPNAAARSLVPRALSRAVCDAAERGGVLEPGTAALVGRRYVPPAEQIALLA
jgi:hypothetical protein